MLRNYLNAAIQAQQQQTYSLQPFKRIAITALVFKSRPHSAGKLSGLMPLI
ncbi:hypothetical protein L3X07_11110 [Levilactobacillus brevis]|nr:hypothetical protein [Levilactobacillus brevis]